MELSIVAGAASIRQYTPYDIPYNPAHRILHNGNIDVSERHKKFIRSVDFQT